MRYKSYPKYKDSGLEWLGDVPVALEGWEVVSLKYISKITLGKMLTSTDKGNMTLKPYLKAKNLKWFNVNVNETDKMWFTKNELKSLRLKKDDLLVSEGGEVGRTCIWNDELDECYIQNSVNRVQFSKHNERFFLYQFFSAGQFGYFDSIVNKISIAHLTKEKLGDVKFVKVPLKEQLQMGATQKKYKFIIFIL
jgi:type I restriction enzyme S subunit